MDKEPEMTTIHCLKSTALSWAGKAGLNAETRQVLGHHSTGKHSHEIYNRDLLAEPIRQLGLILQRIRTGAFLPDASRSGMITEPSVEDPSNRSAGRRATAHAQKAVPQIRPVTQPPWTQINTRRMCMTQYKRKKSGIQTSICTNIVGPT